MQKNKAELYKHVMCSKCVRFFYSYLLLATEMEKFLRSLSATVMKFQVHHFHSSVERETMF